MIVITNPFFIEDEIQILHSLLEEGLSLLHIRKPDFSELEMAQFLHQIKLEFRDKMVLHNHHELAEDFGINRFHFSEKERINDTDYPARFSKPCRSKSTSTHSIKDFNSLENNFDYAFLSPVFKSISKENYSPKKDLFKEIKSRTNYKTKIVALGGIHSENIQKTLENGFDDIALLGAVWNNKNPLKEFKSCQKIVLSHLQSQV
ncbi:thiamine-phosphate pyrophosphorylase [Flavobacterium nitrogenifigens]|uniref:Thiamine-phosphate pyrophosphorylase n=2 Tax=Flavobacterium TaxID=237 RepID=A0A7W7N526_9FLAO|nr:MULTISPECIES: thiamine phosphate synthase [Flavobacterium]MBB4800255.1 thiamine-phosphate pyrophosphorylase [Flavobacterium nitrogenifigens]MBB6385995.1 thiamine-phosphate pyrophosphorylase [Flavobacterium notoginsengisoli]